MTGSALATAEGNSAGVDGSNRIPEPMARWMAKSRVEHNSKREHFSEFDPEGLAQPELFYSVSETGTYRPAAWVYPIRVDGEEVGHVAVSARPDSPGVIRSSTGIAPQTRLQRNRTLRSQTKRAGDGPRFIYNNPMSFGVEIPAMNVSGTETAEGGKPMFADLKHGYTASIDAAATPESASQTDGKSTAARTTMGVAQSEETSFSPLSTGSISSVPNWDGDLCSIGKNWVGCTPAASSMCIGYHENISDRDCDLMWELNDLMGTDSDGITLPLNPGGKSFASGIANYDGKYDYTPRNIARGGRRSEIKDQIDSGNPCLLSHWWKDNFEIDIDWDHIDNPEDFVELPIGHSETVFEYEEGDNPWWNPTEPTMYVSTYDTYGDVDEFTLKSTSVKFLVQTIEP